jgi:hypothetical protein
MQSYVTLRVKVNGHFACQSQWRAARTGSRLGCERWYLTSPGSVVMRQSGAQGVTNFSFGEMGPVVQTGRGPTSLRSSLGPVSRSRRSAASCARSGPSVASSSRTCADGRYWPRLRPPPCRSPALSDRRAGSSGSVTRETVAAASSGLAATRAPRSWPLRLVGTSAWQRLAARRRTPRVADGVRPAFQDRLPVACLTPPRRVERTSGQTGSGRALCARDGGGHRRSGRPVLEAACSGAADK